MHTKATGGRGSPVMTELQGHIKYPTSPHATARVPRHCFEVESILPEVLETPGGDSCPLRPEAGRRSGRAGSGEPAGCGETPAHRGTTGRRRACGERLGGCGAAGAVYWGCETPVQNKQRVRKTMAATFLVHIQPNMSAIKLQQSSHRVIVAKKHPLEARAPSKARCDVGQKRGHGCAQVPSFLPGVRGVGVGAPHLVCGL